MHKLTQISIGMLWLINGLYCKCLNGVPRHGQIVAAILGDEHSALFTLLIGLGEIAIACWMFSGMALRICILLQVVLVVAMNAIEFYAVPHLLLFGRYNAIWAAAFIMFLCYWYQQQTISTKKIAHV